MTQESHISEIDFEQIIASLRKFFVLRTQKGSPVGHSPFNIYYIAQ